MEKNRKEFIRSLNGFPIAELAGKRERERLIIAAARTDSADINPELYKAYADNLRKGVAGVFADSEKYGDIQAQLSANVSRFAAYKAHQATRELKQQRTDPDGKERSPQEYERMAKAVIGKYNRYQVAEYNTAVARSRTAKQWTDFTSDDPGNDLYPNLEWLPSRSANPREEHMAFYGLILPKNHPFWLQNQPGNLWNCKCDWQETYHPAAPSAPTQTIAHPGLEGNPAETGEAFSDKASYFKHQPKDTAIEGVDNSDYLFKKPSEWRVDYFTENNGVLVTERERIKSGQLNDHEKAKYAKEWAMCQTLAKNGQKIEFLAERPGEYDILYNGKPADLKKTKSHNNIVKYAHKAINRQGADYVIFEFEASDLRIMQELNWLKNHGYAGKVIYYMTNVNVLHSL